MSGLFDYIRDFENQHQYQYQMMGGAVALDDEQKKHIESVLSTIDNNLEGYEELKRASERGTLPDTYASYEDASVALQKMVEDSSRLKLDTNPDLGTITTTLLAIPPNETGLEIVPIDTNNETGSNMVLTDTKNETDSEIVPINTKNETGPVAAYDVIKPGTILYHPSQDVSRFDNSMLFVDVTKVLNKNEQRSFCMFFTPNEEYARRYSGLWSLNKRPVYLHKLKVKEGKPITGIKVIDARIVPSNIDNLDLAKRISGPSEDGTINGIKIEQKLDNSPPVDEYYICNPEVWFDLVETWMQFGSTEWVKITKDNVRTIQVPQNGNENENENENYSIPI